MKGKKKPVIQLVEQESWQWLGSECTQYCSVYGCPNKGVWKRTYKSAYMSAPGFYYHCEEHASR